MSTQDPTNDNYRKTFDCALRLLTRRDHSRHELVQKLRMRSFETGDIRRAVAECLRLNYLNDERTAQGFIRQRARQGYGVKRIQYEMNKKGLRGEHFEDMLARSISEADELAGARRVLEKKRKRFEREADPFKRRGKLYRFLYARGFSESVITQVLKQDDKGMHTERSNIKGEKG